MPRSLLLGFMLVGLLSTFESGQVVHAHDRQLLGNLQSRQDSQGLAGSNLHVTKTNFTEAGEPPYVVGDPRADLAIFAYLATDLDRKTGELDHRVHIVVVNVDTKHSTARRVNAIGFRDGLMYLLESVQIPGIAPGGTFRLTFHIEDHLTWTDDAFFVGFHLPDRDPFNDWAQIYY